jgi:hypothetical protein
MKIQCSKLLTLMMLGLVVLFTSCGDDDPIIDPGTGGINVADGLYLALDGQDPSSSAALTSESVEDEGFVSQSRTGFTGGVMYLAAGDYNVVQVTAKEITATIGGAATVATDEGSACDYNDYTVVSTEADGAAFNVANAGLYKVTHDQMTNELILHQIESASIIGAATPGGWGADTPLDDVTIAADGASFQATDVILRSGQWKIRLNCRWSIARLTDPNGGLAAENGYQLFTNYGGSIDNLLIGNDGANMEVAEDGVYTITFRWSPQDGVSGSLERTGDAPDLTFNPNDFNMAVVGDATAGGWGDPFKDRDLLYKYDNDNMTHRWYGVVQFASTGAWKFRANDAWDFNLGGDLAALAEGGGDLASPGLGGHYVVLSTADDGATWSATVSDMGWSVIGDGSPSGNWDNDTAFDADVNWSDGVSTYTLIGDFTTADWKFRAGGDWPLNLGGAFSFLELDGGNVSLGMDGTYRIELNFDGSVYTASATLQ